MPTTVLTRTRTKPIPNGMRTHRRKFIFPILEALNNLGGSATTSQVLSEVENLMRGTLNRVDYQHLNSRPTEIRWRNTSRWTKDAMIGLGLIASNSPRGVWEITDLGYDFLSLTR